LKLIPYERFTIETDLTPEEVRERLAANVKPWPFFRLAGTPAGSRYEGKCGERSFVVTRSIGYVNSAIPFVFGEYRRGDDGTVIEIRMRPHLVVLGFAALWTAMAASFVAFLAYHASRGEASWGAPVMPLLMLPFAYLFCVVFFWLEAKTTRRDLYQLFDARSEEEQI